MILNYVRNVFKTLKSFFSFVWKDKKSVFYFKLRPYSGNESTKIRRKKTWNRKVKTKIRNRRRNKIARLSRRVNRQITAGKR